MTIVADAEDWLRAAPDDALDVILMDCAPPDADEDAAIEAPMAVFISPPFLNGEVRRALKRGGFYVANIIANDVDALLESLRVFDACFEDVRVLNIDPNTIVFGCNDVDAGGSGAACAADAAACDAAEVVCAAALNKARAELCAVAAHASTTAAAAAAAAAAASGAARKAQNGFERAHVARRKAWVSALGVRAAARERFRAAAVEYGASGNGGECSLIYRYILRESCSQFDSLPLTYLTIAAGGTRDGGSERSGCAADVGRAELVERIRHSPAAARLTRDVTMLYLDSAAHAHNIAEEQAFGWFSSREFHTLCEARDDFGVRLFEC